MVKRVFVRRVRIYTVLFIFIAIILGIAFLIRPKTQLVRESLVFVGDPTVVVSWEGVKKKYVLLTFPSDLRIEGLHKYGYYSLSSLFRLDEIEKRGGDLYLSSLSENFALPIKWYIMDTNSVGAEKSEIVQFVLSKTSLWSLLRSFFVHTTSISLFDIFHIWRATRAIDADTSKVIDFRSVSISDSSQLPDGTMQKTLNLDAYDGIIGDILEDISIRQESIRIAILNTTDMSGIGGRIARIIEHFGGFVVYVGNDDQAFDGICEIRGTKERLSSITSKVIQRYFHCISYEATESDRGDLTIRLGTLLKKRYLPY